MKAGIILALTLLAAFACAPSQAQDSAAGDMNVTREARGASFLTRIRVADPDYRLVLMAGLKENELSLLLSRFVKTDEIPTLVTGLAGLLSKQFPGENLTVVAFRPNVPLTEAGIAHVNGGTGQISYVAGPAGAVAP
jgi:hypothetical protein